MSKIVERDIEVAIKILYGNDLFFEDTECYNKIYPWTNEQIEKYYNYYSLLGKKVLCVTSSGDHLLWAVYGGSRKIQCFDKNGLSKYYSALKVASIKAFDEERFYKLFKRQSISKKLNINDIKCFLTEDEFLFWSELVSCKNFKNNYRLFRTDGGIITNLPPYNELKISLLNADIKYIDCDVFDISKLDIGKYDIIFLSNILDWFKYRSNIISELSGNLLNDNGIIYDYTMSGNYLRDLNTCEKIIVDKGIPGLERNTSKSVLVYRKQIK